MACCVWLFIDVGSAANKQFPRHYVAARGERAGLDAAASYRRPPCQSKMRIQRPRMRGYDSSSQKVEVLSSDV